MQTTICQEKRLGDNPRITILNTEIDVLNVNETIALVEKYVQTKTPLHLMGVNADKINEVNQNAKMREIVNSCGVINADGAYRGCDRCDLYRKQDWTFDIVRAFNYV